MPFIKIVVYILLFAFLSSPFSVLCGLRFVSMAFPRYLQDGCPSVHCQKYPYPAIPVIFTGARKQFQESGRER